MRGVQTARYGEGGFICINPNALLFVLDTEIIQQTGKVGSDGGSAMSDPFRLDGRRAIVTGANTGIGQAIAVSLAERGAHVFAAGRSSTEETVEIIQEAGGSCEGFVLDLSDPTAGAARLPEAGPLDILVNNAGIISRADAVDYSEQD